MPRHGLPVCLAIVLSFVAAACAPSNQAVRAATPTIRATVRPATTPPTLQTQDDALLQMLQANDANAYGVVIEDLASGARMAYNEDRVFASGSVYKLPVAWEILRQVDLDRINLDSTMEITDADAIEVEPDGGLSPGETPTVREALRAMIGVSSNAAAHALLRTLGRREFNQAVDNLGLRQTRVPELSSDGADDSAEAVTSAQDISRLLRMLATHQGLSETSLYELQALLARGAPPDALRDTLANDVRVLEKTGNLDDASNVAALLLTQQTGVILVVLDEGVDPGDARTVIAELGQAAYERYLRLP
jgi:beta-lactamase class A